MRLAPQSYGVSLPQLQEADLLGNIILHGGAKTTPKIRKEI